MNDQEGRMASRRVERQWEVRFETVYDEAGRPVDVIEDREATAQALLEVEGIGHRVGGGFIFAPIRAKVVDPRTEVERVVVAGWSFEWVKFMPAVQLEDLAEGGLPSPSSQIEDAAPAEPEVGEQPAIAAPEPEGKLEDRGAPDEDEVAQPVA